MLGEELFTHHFRVGRVGILNPKCSHEVRESCFEYCANDPALWEGEIQPQISVKYVLRMCHCTEDISPCLERLQASSAYSTKGACMLRTFVPGLQGTYDLIIYAATWQGPDEKYNLL